MAYHSIALSLALFASTSLFAQFTPGPYLPKPAERAADFNGDGLDDLLAFDYGTAVHTLHFNEGNGVFGPEIVPGAFLPGERVFVAGDLNGDARADLVVAGPRSADDHRNLRVLHGDGRGGFAEVQRAVVAELLLEVEANGDKRADLLAIREDWTAFPPRTSITPLLSRADGTLAVADDLQLGTPVYYAAGGDYTGDGIGDLVLTGPGGVYVANGFSGGRFGAPVRRYDNDLVRRPLSGDFDGDGRLDLAFSEVLADATHTVTVLLGAGDGTFARSLRLPMWRGEHRWDNRNEVKQLLGGHFSGDPRAELLAVLNDGSVFTLAVEGERIEQRDRMVVEPWPTIRTATLRPERLDLLIEWQRGVERSAAIWYSVP